MAILNDNGVNVAPRRNYFKEMAADPNAAYARRFVPMLTGGQPKNTSQMMAEKAQQLSTNMRGGNRGNGPVEKAQGTVMPAVNPNSATDGVNALAKMMGYTTPEEEQRLQKASMANRRIMAVADALRQIGNIYNTSRYAPAQKFNSPVMEEQARYERGKALRDRANQTYLTYQQAKAKQDAEQKRWEATFNYNAAKDKATMAFNRQKAADDLKEKQRQYDSTLELNKRKADDTKAANEARIKMQERQNQASNAIRWYSAKTARMNAEYKQNGGGSGSRGGSRGGRGSTPYTYPTKKGYVQLERDLNPNNIGKGGLIGEMSKRGYLSDDDRIILESKYTDSATKKTVLDRVISNWMMNDDSASSYMEKHYGASIFEDEDYDDGLVATESQQTGRTGGNVFTPYWSTYGSGDSGGGGKSLGLNIGGVTGTTANKKLGIGL